MVHTAPYTRNACSTILLRRIFEISPSLKGSFAFGEESDEVETILGSARFERHAKLFVGTIDTVMNMLGPDLEMLADLLQDLGAKHSRYGVTTTHHPIMGEALLEVLQKFIGKAWTPTVEDGWTGLYTYMSSMMIRGARPSVPSVDENKAVPGEVKLGS